MVWVTVGRGGGPKGQIWAATLLGKGRAIHSYEDILSSVAIAAESRRIGPIGAFTRLRFADFLVIASIWGLGLFQLEQITIAIIVSLSAMCALMLFSLGQMVQRFDLGWTVRELAFARMVPIFISAMAVTMLAWSFGGTDVVLLAYWLCCMVLALTASSILVVLYVRQRNGGADPVSYVGIANAQTTNDANTNALRHKLASNLVSNNDIEIVDRPNLELAVLHGAIHEIVQANSSEPAIGECVFAGLPVDLVRASVQEPLPEQGVDRSNSGLRAPGWRLENVHQVALDEGWMWLKRVFDAIVASLLLIIFLPLLALVALAVKLTSPGSVFFRQERVGLYQRPFSILKFRSLHTNKSDPLSLKQARLDDPRVTPVGRFLRASCLDELPQLWNVVRGDMALVGPRPHAPMTCVDGVAFEDMVKDYARRHCVRPGLTGLAQISGCRGPVETRLALEKRLAFDLAYIEKWSWRYDMAILVRSAGVPFAPLLAPLIAKRRRASSQVTTAKHSKT